MNTYLTVAAVRIQSWLVRTPALKALRGASAALARETSRRFIEEAVSDWDWQAYVQIVESAGEIDGVVVLTVATPRRPDEVADRLMRHLGQALPGVDWEAWWVDAPSYATAFLLFESDDGSLGRLRRLSPLLEATLAGSCRGCRLELALQPGGFGADCRVREAAADATPRVGTFGRPARTFEELAGLGGRADAERVIGRRLSSNHLATVVADGNQVGHVFSRIRELAGEAVLERAVAALSHATNAALEQAFVRVAPQSRVHPGIVHYVGGDDVFVSVPARLAWRFCTFLAAGFAFEMRQRLNELLSESSPLAEPIQPPSLGVGMVFAEASHPIADTRALATSALKQAKKATRGLRSAVVWTDLTTESHPPSDRVVELNHLLADLDGALEDAQQRLGVMKLSPSARSSLAGLINGSWGTGADAEVDDTAALAAAWARRTGNDLPSGLTSIDTSTRRAAVAMTRDLLSRARWWPAGAVRPSAAAVPGAAAPRG